MTPYALLAPPSRVSPGNLVAESDERLVELARAGSEPAFEGIVARYRLPLTRYCARLAPEGQAEDTVQDTFVRAFRALERGEQVLRLRPWLYRIAHNTALNSIRGQRPHDQPLEDLYEGADTTTAAAELRLGLRDTVSAVQALPLRQRSVIVQHELEGRSYEEIASRLGVTSAAVRQLLSRARTSLRAGAAALVAPLAPLSRLAVNMADAPAAGRVAELCGAGGSGIAAKLCATAVVSGVIAGGIQPAVDVSPGAPGHERDARAATQPRAAAERRVAANTAFAAAGVPRRAAPAVQSTTSAPRTKTAPQERRSTSTGTSDGERGRAPAARRDPDAATHGGPERHPERNERFGAPAADHSDPRLQGGEPRETRRGFTRPESGTQSAGNESVSAAPTSGRSHFDDGTRTDGDRSGGHFLR